MASWENYCRLFDALLDCSDTNFVITEDWAFDLVHEFVYQFQSFCQMRGQVRYRSVYSFFLHFFSKTPNLRDRGFRLYSFLQAVGDAGLSGVG